MTADQRVDLSLHQQVVSLLDIRNTGRIPEGEESMKERAEQYLRAELKRILLPDDGRGMHWLGMATCPPCATAVRETAE